MSSAPNTSDSKTPETSAPHTNSASGQCLCGAVRVKANNVATAIGTCHCSICRKWTGGPMFAVDCQQDVEFSGQQHIHTYISSAWAERGFCGQCGTHLYYRLNETGQWMLPVGLLDSHPDFIFDHQVFIDEKPDYYAFANSTHNLTGAELFALYGADPAPDTDPA